MSLWAIVPFSFAISCCCSHLPLLTPSPETSFLGKSWIFFVSGLPFCCQLLESVHNRMDKQCNDAKPSLSFPNYMRAKASWKERERKITCCWFLKHKWAFSFGLAPVIPYGARNIFCKREMRVTCQGWQGRHNLYPLIPKMQCWWDAQVGGRWDGIYSASQHCIWGEGVEALLDATVMLYVRANCILIFYLQYFFRPL